MSKKDKALQRLLSRPKDYTWDELVKLLKQFGYTELKNGKTGGSRRKFSDADQHLISFHQPHPGNIVKAYAIDDLIKFLKERGHLPNE